MLDHAEMDGGYYSQAESLVNDAGEYEEMGFERPDDPGILDEYQGLDLGWTRVILVKENARYKVLWF